MTQREGTETDEDIDFAEQFSKYANIFFLFTACIQQIPGVSPTSRYTTIVPLAMVLIVAAFKEMQEDLVRRPALASLSCADLFLARSETPPIGLGPQLAQSQSPRQIGRADV